MIELRQQTSREFMFTLSPQECRDLLDSVRRLGLNGQPRILRINLHATALGAPAPQDIDFEISRGPSDRLVRRDDRVELSLDPDATGELTGRLEQAVAVGYFVPAELMIVEGKRGEWLHLYAVTV